MGRSTLVEPLITFAMLFTGPILMWKDFFSGVGSETEKVARAEANAMGIDALNFVVMPTLGLVSGLIIGYRESWQSGIAVGVSVTFVGFFLIGAIVTTSLVVLALSIGSLLDIGVIEPVAWLLDRPDVGLLVRIMGLVLLIVGLHFDLLAS